MKILAFTDIHGSAAALKRLEQKVKSQNPDLLVCAGDISIFENGLIGIMRRLDRMGRKIVMVHGNHEDDSTFAKIAKSSKNIIFIHQTSFVIDNILFLGYGGGGFAMTDKEFEKTANSKFRKLVKAGNKKVILITHGPPYKTRLDRLMQGHCGSKSLRNFIEKSKIDYLICGHLHENFGKEDRIKKTKCINPGPFGKIIEVLTAIEARKLIHIFY